LLVASATTATAQEVPTEGGPPAGLYVFVPEESERIEDAIDRAADHMNFLIRPIAKRRLRGANEPIERIEIAYPGSDVRVVLRQDEPPIVSPRSGAAVPYRRADGEVV